MQHNMGLCCMDRQCREGGAGFKLGTGGVARRAPGKFRACLQKRSESFMEVSVSFAGD